MNDILYLKQNGKIKLEDQDDNNEDPRSDLSVEEFLQNNENVAAARKYITEKYLYAGGSARFMFEYTTSELEKRLRGLFGFLRKHDWDAFTSSALAPSATSSVNSLMQQLNGRATAVSRYVLFEAYDRVEGDLVKAVQAAADMSENPALIGWAFELRQLHTIKTVLTNNSRLLFFFPKMFLKSKEGLCFRPLKNGEASFDGNKLIKHNNRNLNSGTIIWCMKWNQGCFDFAFFKKGTLMTLQFTVAAEHTLKVQFIKDLRNAIEENSSVSVNNFIHIGVVGGNDDVLREFMFQTPEGLGRRSNGTRRDFTLKTYKSSELVIQRSRNESFAATSLGDYEVYTRKREL
eukprot:scaffold8412_cov155-Cylindrotheca_fusiformis.AAC.1